MDLVGMEIFARVAEARSFSAAARRLHLSKSVVSKHVTKLEQGLGVRLLNRTTRSISLTEIGHEFYARCAEILAAAEEAELSAMRLQAAPRGTLRFTAPVSFGMLQVAPALPDLLAACPELCVEMALTNRLVNVVEEGFDVSLVGGEPHPGMVARRVATVRLRVCASPEYLARCGAPESPLALRDHNCLQFNAAGYDKRWCLVGPDGEERVPVSGNLVTNNVVAVHCAAIAGAGIALLPTFIAGDDLRRGKLVAVLTDHPPPDIFIQAVYPPNRQLSPKVRALVDFLTARFGPEPPWDAPWQARDTQTAVPVTQ